MKRSAFNAIPKVDDEVCNGNSEHHHDPTKFACRNKKWRQCSSLSSILTVLFTLNSFHRAKQWTKLIVWEYWSGYMNT